MKIKATRVSSKELQPGDLFSTIHLAYWEDWNLHAHEEMGATGQKVYIRTGAKSSEDEMVTKIEIIKE